MFNIEERVKWIQNKVKEAGAVGAVVAISGGIDSAVVAGLAKKAFPSNSLGVFIGIDSSTTSKRNFLRTVHKLNIKNVSLNLSESFNKLVKDTFEVENAYASLDVYEEYEKTGIAPIDKSYLDNPNLDLIKGNIKARLRMTTIYAYAQKNNYLVLETSNKSELEIGYFTKWGDGVGDLAPISDLLKSEVYELANELEIPEQIINTPPSADLWKGQTDEGELGFTYKDLEDYIKGDLIDYNIKDKINNIKKRNQHKSVGIMKFKE